MKILRTDQSAAMASLQATIDSGSRRIMIQAPTAWGKTIVSAAILGRYRGFGNRVLFIVPALSLIDQTVQVFRANGLDEVGVIQAQNELTNWDMPIQVASVQTLQRRDKLPPASIIMIDEAHVWFKFYGKLLLDPQWKDIPIVGLSATPWTKGLGAYYTDLILAGTTQSMIDAGHLSDFKVYAPSSPDLKGVRTLAGDYHEGDLSSAMDKAPLVANIVETWLKRGENRPTLCFAVDRAHAKNLQKQFIDKGVPAEYQDAYTDDFARRIIRAKFHAGEAKVVCNVGTLTTGVDWDVRCIILARPTKSEMLFVQIVGRGLRTADGKDHCLILDHSDNHLRLGFVTDIHYDKLNDGTAPVSAKADGIKLPKKCPECSYLKPPASSVCPSCGFIAKAQDKIKVRDGELRELERRQKDHSPAWDNKKSVYGQLTAIARRTGKKDGWAYYKFIEKYGTKPPWDWRGYTEEPQAEILSWAKSRNIAWSKSKNNPHIPNPVHVPTPEGRKPFIPGTLMTEDDAKEMETW